MPSDLSHSGDRGTAAGAGEIGIDVERIDPDIAAGRSLFTPGGSGPSRPLSGHTRRNVPQGTGRTEPEASHDHGKKP
ncbi:MAG: hypothetical protein A9Z00_00405 [Thermobacillus sp. ZCTH02-B1]|nr:MAG: hypothetical protein A9Z00_00405 [Thermobacillus sp. ZCTH02-B1]